MFSLHAALWANGEIQVPLGLRVLAFFYVRVLIRPPPPPLTVRLGFKMEFLG